MLDFVCEGFPESRGSPALNTVPLFPGMHHGVAPAPTPLLTRAPPIDYMVEQASTALARANEATRLSFAEYPSKWHYISVLQDLFCPGHGQSSGSEP